jgi:hypothetical protein
MRGCARARSVMRSFPGGNIEYSHAESSPILQGKRACITGDAMTCLDLHVAVSLRWGLLRRPDAKLSAQMHQAHQVQHAVIVAVLTGWDRGL